MTTLSLAFHPGQMIQTRSIFDACCEHRPFFTFVSSCIARHLRGEWGDLCTDDAALNDAALLDGSRIFSVYTIPAGLYTLSDRIWIITESSREYTTVLFPSDY